MKTLSGKVSELSTKYHLTECSIDVECIYQMGDLSEVLKESLSALLPDTNIEISEALSEDNDRYVATLSHEGRKIIDIFADTHADFLPDSFSMSFESIPALLGTTRLFCLINPTITGQLMWYICGLPQDLESAKSDGLPIILPGEDFMAQDVSEYLP